MAQQPQGSGFTNIQNILNANQGNQLGQAVGSGVQNVANQATQGLNTAQQNFQNQTQQGLQTLQTDKSNEQSVLQNPVNASDQDVANFAQYRGGQYSGPTSLGDTTAIQNQAQNAQQLGQAAGTTAGRLGLLQQFASGGKQYTSGQQNLDNLLLGSSANDNLNSARRVSTGLVNNVNQANQNAQNTGRTVAGQYQNFGNQVNSDIQAQQNPMLGSLTQAANTQQAQKDATAARIQAGLQSGTLSASDAQLLGLTNGQNIDNVDLTRFLTVDPTKANQQNVANAQQTSQLNALARLAGQGAFSTDPSQAGKFGQNQFQYDTSGLNQTVAQHNTDYNNSNLQNQNLQNDINSKFSQLGGDNYISALKQFGLSPNDPNIAGKLNDIYQQSLNNQYTGPGSGVGQIAQGGGNYGKDIREGLFGDSTLGGSRGGGPANGDIRQALMNYLDQYNQSSQATKALQNQYGIGKNLTVTPDNT